jgi:ABC-type multidrug transport system permease subunit
MITRIMRNEWRRHLLTPAWWLLAAASWLICAWLLFAQLQVYQQIQPRLVASGTLLGVNDLLIAPTLNTLSLLILLSAPLLGMNAISEERRSGRLPLLLSGPLSPARLLLGKWLGILLPLWLIVLIVFGMLASLAPGMHLDWPRLGVSLLGLLMLGALAAAIGLLGSSLARQAAGAFATALGLLGLLWLGDSFLDPQAPGYWLALAPRLARLLRGVLYSDDLVYFATLGLAALVGALPPLLRIRERPRWRPLREGLALALLVLCVIGAAHLSQQHRQTLYRSHPLPRALLESLDALRGPITITAYAPPLPLLRARIEKLIRPLQEYHPALRLRWLDPQREPQLARQLGIRHNGELRIEGMGRSQRVEHADYPALTRALRRLGRHGAPWILRLRGQGEAAADNRPDGISGWIGALEAYGYQVIDLSADAPLPDNARLALVVGPQRAFSQAQRRHLAEWVTRGGRVLWLHEGGAEATLMAISGVSSLPGVLVSPLHGTDRTPLQQTLEVPALLAPADTQAALLDGAHALLPPDGGGWKLAARLDSDPKAWNETGPLRGQVSQQPLLGEIKGPHALGLLLTRGDQRLAVLGDSDLARNALFGRGGNRALLLGLINWLNNEHLATRVAADDLEITWTPLGGGLLAVFHLLIGPLLLAAGGFWLRRRRQRA